MKSTKVCKTNRKPSERRVETADVGGGGGGMAKDEIPSVTKSYYSNVEFKIHPS
jgi:hypothetical protein